MMKAGILYGVGVGPGDPELMTVKAWRLISTTSTIAYLAANGQKSVARQIAEPFIAEGAKEIALDVPMHTAREPAQLAYDAGAAVIASQLEDGNDVVVLCEGDPFFYGSFMYIFARLSQRYTTVVVPGVTSLTASAAVLGRPLAARNEILKVLPATLDADLLYRELEGVESAAIIKVGRHFTKVREILEALRLIDHAVVIEKATHVEERIVPARDILSASIPYFSTILIYAGAEEW